MYMEQKGESLEKAGVRSEDSSPLALLSEFQGVA